MVTNPIVPLRTRRLTAWVAIVAVLATVLVVALEPLRFAYGSSEVHVAIATAASLIALLGAGLVLPRFRRSHSLQDLALSGALLVLSGSNLFFSAMPTAFGELHSHFVAWAPFVGRLVGAILFALSVAVPDREVRDVRRAALATLAGALVVLGAIAAGTAILSPDWGDPLRDMVTPAASNSPRLTGDVVALVVEAVVAGLYVVAAIGFVARAERSGDELFAWFALASPPSPRRSPRA